ncbi:sulfite exporter TauE/SafE family protein [Desulforamulus ferrireducens]|uniref:Probable membrane transporter protein n=1 Tax=Desulforamulus ferrireducens TaxID=1833852 RepID=A0A1S6IZP6_9FIRM|nr:sulfite exporter TauE/SafE family protein [Desulforamulus ferrireducens]AQS60241.1 integrase [Desulforamulus ferrireducens]
MSTTEIIIVLIAGLVSGFVNVVGGGGSLISMPALIFMGLPSAVANGTNRVALMVQSLVAIGYFRNKGYFYPKLSAIFGIPAVLGSIVGAKFAISLSDDMFNKILAIVMIVVAVLVIVRPEKRFLNMGEIGENLSKPRLILASLAFFGVGFYGGFIQAGVGFIIIAAMALITGMSLVKINSIKVSVTIIYIFASLLVFVLSGKVDWVLGIVLSLGNAVGAYFGSMFSVSKGDKWIRIFLVVSVVLMSAKLLGVHKLIGF